MIAASFQYKSDISILHIASLYDGDSISEVLNSARKDCIEYKQFLLTQGRTTEDVIITIHLNKGGLKSTEYYQESIVKALDNSLTP